MLHGRHAAVAALIAAIALSLAPAGAAAAEPVLEFVVPNNSFPLAVTTEGGAVSAEMSGFGILMHCTASHGEGEITGPRTAVARFVFTGCTTKGGASVKCQSVGASAEEIKTGTIAEELVYLDQAKHEVAILVNPSGWVYMEFECGGEHAEARGPFLAAVGPVNEEASSFTTTLSDLAGEQTPDEYENLRGERFKAIPEGSRNGKPFVTTGVEGTIVIDPAQAGSVRAISVEEVQAKEHEEAVQREHAAEAKQHEQEAKQHEEAALRQHEQEVKQQEEAAAKRRQEEAAAKQHEEEAAAAATTAAKQKRQEEAAKQKRLLAKALKQCKRQPAKRRAQCKAKAEKRYGAKQK
jgi:hypothetical protein